MLLLPSLLQGQCNGHLQLCNRPYNEVSFLTTHNAFNAGEEGFALPNQNFGLTAQLQFGVRALMLDVYDDAGVTTVYHGFSFLGTATLASNLEQIKAFMDDNPNEVITIIFETYVSSAMMNEVFTEAGLIPYLHAQTLGEAWPTLQQMIDSNQRLVVFSDQNDALSTQEWYHYIWDHAVETHFSNNSPVDFSCDLNRGDSINDLFIVNHFVTSVGLGTGQPDQAAIVNELSFFYDRVYACQQEKQKFPNFPTVDFYELGQTIAVIDSLNGIQSTLGLADESRSGSFSVFPNPSAGIFEVAEHTAQAETPYRLYDSNSVCVAEGTLSARQQGLNLSSLTDGVYCMILETEDPVRSVRLIKLSSLTH